MNQKQKRILMAFIGVLVTGCSVGLFQMASLGTDPFTSFVKGLCNVFNIKFGTFYSIICAFIFFIVFRLDKDYIGIATFFNLFGNGFAADATTSIISKIIPNLTVSHRVVLLIAGIVLMCLAASLYFTADLGVSVYDAISIIMSHKKIASFRTCRIATDSVCVAIGFALKASIGVGTVITALFMGPLIQFFKTYVAEPLLYYKRTDSSNSRNGRKSKTIRSKYGEIDIEVPQDRESTFEPKIVKKRQEDISWIEEKIISMYAKGLTTRQISDQIDDIYGFEISEGMVSDITNKLLQEIEAWQQRPLSSIYPIVFIDAVHFSVRDNNIIRKLAAYIILGINEDGRKEVLSIQIGENESSKYWLSVLNEIKNRGVKDILIICADGPTGIKESIAVAFPNTEYQRCIVHQVRNTLKYVADKNKKEFAEDLKSIYHAPSEEVAFDRIKAVSEKWQSQYPNAMKSWNASWDANSLIFKFSADVRKIIYNTNVIESLNSTYRRLNRRRSVFPNDTALLKALYLATFEASKKWSLPLKNWDKVYGELSMMYEGRLV